MSDQCNRCGAPLNFNKQNHSTTFCEYCGKRFGLYKRAGDKSEESLRRTNKSKNLFKSFWMHSFNTNRMITLKNYLKSIAINYLFAGLFYLFALISYFSLCEVRTGTIYSCNANEFLKFILVQLPGIVAVFLTFFSIIPIFSMTIRLLKNKK